MNALDLSTNQQYPNKKPIIKMSTFLRSTVNKLYNAVSALVIATRNETAESAWNCFFTK